MKRGVDFSLDNSVDLVLGALVHAPSHEAIAGPSLLGAHCSQSQPTYHGSGGRAETRQECMDLSVVEAGDCMGVRIFPPKPVGG